MSLTETLKLSFDMTKVLTNMEVNGIKINVDTLHQLRDEYQTELLTTNLKLMWFYPILYKERRSTS